MYKENGFAKINDTNIYYELAGTGDPVLLLHGDSTDHSIWDEQFDVFAERHLVIRIDFRGFGKSDKSDSSQYSNVDDVAALLNHFNLDSVHLVGQSMGADVAIDFAAKYPDRVKGLIVLDSALSTDHSLNEVKATTLILVSQHAGELQQNSADRLRKEIPRNTKFTLPNLGSLANMKDPETFNSVVLIFLGQFGCGCSGG